MTDIDVDGIEVGEHRGAPVVLAATRRAWEDWLARHHADRTEVWLKIAKKSAKAERTIDAQDGLRGALCFGWIDSVRHPLDGEYFLQRYGPRRAKSPWSRRNIGIVGELTAAGRMREPGLAEVERAKADGRWATGLGTG
ncbi:hypothetical protein Afil01_38800 [Actinorhabdospora filicis]|uniref:Uncharacterized protein n=1 Tax=Actinorhabdospora filicis TaxID=1785913 RepID=A0A9W6WAJ2_9ACTN|nr:hypothetical protein [Actinorhabdospora filicis]GLZ79073.1 hypothetical protein Afil01_38800 [Actinorhabdospora filicis]